MVKITITIRFQHTAARRRLTAPVKELLDIGSFNTQPPEGGWRPFRLSKLITTMVSTHSRPKAAGQSAGQCPTFRRVSTHSRPKAAGFHFHHLIH